MAYKLAIHPVKISVNEWLLSILTECVKPSAISWAFILESSACLTCKTFSSTINYFVICNPDKKECDKILERFPSTAIVFPLLSHVFLPELVTETSDAYIKLLETTASPWCGCFDFIWLDYCGSISGKAGKSKFNDIKTLINSMQGGRLLHTVLMAVTFSQRGSQPELQKGETLHKLIEFIEQQALSVSLYTKVMGCVTYNRDGAIMYTLAVIIGTSQAILDSIEPLPDIEATGLTFISPALLKPLPYSGSDLSITPLSAVVSHAAAAWTACIISSLPTASSSLSHPVDRLQCVILDDEILSCSRSLLTQCVDLGPLSKKRAPPSCLTVASITRKVSKSHLTDMGDIVASADKEISVSYHGSLFEFINEDKVVSSDRLLLTTAVWLGYVNRKPMNRSQLVTASEWYDLNAIFKAYTNIACLGIMISITNDCELWADQAVDWLLTGVQACALRHGYLGDIRANRILRYRLNHPYILLIVKLGLVPATYEPGLIAREMPDATSDEVTIVSDECDEESRDSLLFSKHLLLDERNGWDLNRLKLKPTKYSRDILTRGSTSPIEHVSSYMLKLIENYCSTILIYEPGFQHMIPLLNVLPCVTSIKVFEVDGDHVQRHELCRLGLEVLPSDMPILDASPSSPFAHVVSSDCLLILSDSGLSTFHAMWSNIIEAWLHACKREPKSDSFCRILFLHFENSAAACTLARGSGGIIADTSVISLDAASPEKDVVACVMAMGVRLDIPIVMDTVADLYVASRHTKFYSFFVGTHAFALQEINKSKNIRVVR